MAMRGHGVPGRAAIRRVRTASRATASSASGRSVRDVQFDHVYAHAPSVVWKALTDPELHARWWAAGDVPPVVCHRFQLAMAPRGKQPGEVLKVEHGRVSEPYVTLKAPRLLTIAGGRKR